MQQKFDWTDLHEFFTRYFVVDSLSAVWVTPTPFFFGGGGKILIFFTLAFLATSHQNLALMSCTCFLFEVSVTPP